MATRDLRELIKCSGYAGTSGQSFRNHVLGAASGAKMSDYIIAGWNAWSSSPASQGSPGPTFNSGQIFALATSLYGGSRISFITRAGSGLLSLVKGTMPNGADVQVQSTTVTNTPGVNVAPAVNASIKVISGYNTGAVPGLGASAAMSSDGVNDNGPPASGYGYMHFSASVIGGNGISDGGYDDLSFTLNFDPNAGTGQFNNVLSQSFTMRMQHRGYDPSDFTVEWHQNSSYTSLLSGAWNLWLYEGTYAPGGPPSPYSLWMRYKYPGGSSWVNYGEVDCYDGRFSY